MDRQSFANECSLYVEAWHFQDFWMDQLAQQGIFLGNFQSKQFNMRRENLLGMELKQDKNFAQTGNLAFETGAVCQGKMLDSGVMKEDLNWLYAVGDYRELFVFGKNYLRRLYGHYLTHGAKSPFISREVNNGDTHFFLIPGAKARMIAEKIFNAKGA